MQMNKQTMVDLSTDEIAEAIKVYLTTPRVRRAHGLPSAKPEAVEVELGTDGGTATIHTTSKSDGTTPTS